MLKLFTCETTEAVQWNYAIKVHHKTTLQVPLGVNDGEIVLGLLCSCKTDEEVMNVIADIQGPFALVFYQVSQLLFRSSCQRSISAQPSIILTAVVDTFDIQNIHQA